jgi:hypothetical protein
MRARRWDFFSHRIRNGSRQFGCGLWWNGERFGVECRFLVWDLQVVREWKA